MEFVKTPLRVNAMASGGVNTALSANFSMPDDIDFTLMARYMGFRGMAEADEIAGLFSFVARRRTAVPTARCCRPTTASRRS